MLTLTFDLRQIKMGLEADERVADGGCAAKVGDGFPVKILARSAWLEQPSSPLRKRSIRCVRRT
jgi:hypothetical protein